MRAATLLILCIAFWQSGAMPTPENSSSQEANSLDSAESICINELNFDSETLSRINEDDIAAEDIPKRDDFTLCYAVKRGFAKQNGEVDYEGIVDTLFKVATKGEPEGPSLSKTVYRRILTESAEECKSNPQETTNVHDKLMKALDCVSKKQSEKTDEFTNSF